MRQFTDQQAFIILGSMALLITILLAVLAMGERKYGDLSKMRALAIDTIKNLHYFYAAWFISALSGQDHLTTMEELMHPKKIYPSWQNAIRLAQAQSEEVARDILDDNAERLKEALGRIGIPPKEMTIANSCVIIGNYEFDTYDQELAICRLDGLPEDDPACQAWEKAFEISSSGKLLWTRPTHEALLKVGELIDIVDYHHDRRIEELKPINRFKRWLKRRLG